MKTQIRSFFLNNRNAAITAAVVFDVVCLAVILYLVFA